MSISTTINNYSKPHNNGNGGGGGSTYIRGGVSNTDLPADLNVNTISAVAGNINTLTGVSLDYNDGNFIYLNAGNGKIVKLRGDELGYEHGKISDFHSDSIDNTGKITTNELEVTANAFIKDLTSNTITTDYLTVTKQAHFFELIIDKVRSVGGTLIMTPAQCIADYVKAFAMTGSTPDPEHDTEIALADNVDVTTIDYYVIYWLAQDDGSTRKNTNDWIVDDQAYCTSFNVAAGANYDVSNKYYWRLVKATFGDQYMNLNTGATLPLSQAADAAVNSVYINTPTIYYKLNGENNYVNTDWHTYSQIIGPTYEPGDTDPATGAEWDPVSGTGGAGQITQGTMTTKNTIFGIQLQPIADSILSKSVPEKFSFTCSKARLNIGVYYSDNSSEWFPAPELAKTSYEVTLKAVWDDTLNAYVSGNNQTIETVIITNADDVEWKLVHSIALSNNRSECDVPQDHTGDTWFADKYSIPSIGDNITQLGYRYQNVQGYPTNGTDQQIADWISNNQAIYDRSSAQIISANKTPDTEVRPPAYAQYTGINDFSLSAHRGTYIDATGGYFKGKLVSESGTLIDITDQGLGIEVDFYKIIPDYNVITVDSNSQISPSILGVKFLHSGDSNLSTTVPTGCSFNYSIDGATPTTVPAGISVNINTSNMTGSSYLVMNLFKDGDLVDNIRMTVTDIQAASGTAGRNGSYTQYAYQNGATADRPTVSDSTFPPVSTSGQWYANPSTPDFAHGEYTWCTTRTVTFSTTNQPVYGDWVTPYRITGDNGQPGEDGNFTEFIYTRNNTGVAPSAPPHGTYARDWPNDGTTDHQTVNGVTWYDNPQGVTSSMKWEYVSSRQYNGSTKTWSDYSTPAVWAKWGEKGQDGDGYEYIYGRNDSTTVPPNISYNPYGGKTQYDDDFVPENWSDDPQGVTSVASEKCEWVAVRKKTNGDWGLFSTPALWAQYVPPGSQGQNGQYTQYAYQNGATAARPTVSDSTFPPVSTSGQWYANPSTPDFANGEYTWCTTRTISFSSSNQPNYGAWSTPYRVTGDNGMPGEDGDYTEFIYILKSKETTFTGQNNPANWTSSSAQDKYGHNYNDRDYVGPESAGWDDNPTGIDSTNKFEYMSWREYNGSTKSFGPFSEPALWSRYGENGRDGDGVEYIFCRVADESSANKPKILHTAQELSPYTIASNTVERNSGGGVKRWREDASTSTWHDIAKSEYLPISHFERIGDYDYPRTSWTDDPTGVDSTNTCEYVSQRKYLYNSNTGRSYWTNFDDPTIWSMYGGTGPQGPEGPQGPQGPAGPGSDYYSLVPLREIFEVRINAESVGAQAYENITGAVYTDVIYGVVHVSGDSIDYLSRNEIENMFKLEVISNPYSTSLSGVTKQFEQTGYDTRQLNDNANSQYIGVIRFQTNNILAKMWPNNSAYQNYYYLHSQGANGINRAPIKLNVALVKKSDSSQIDHRAISLVFKASHLFSVADTALNSIYQGVSGTNGPYTKTGFSNVRQTWEQISLGVNNLKLANENKLEQNTDIDEYIYHRNNNKDKVDAYPQATSWGVTPANWYAYNNYPAPTHNYPYTWQSHRTRKQRIDDTNNIVYEDVSNWSEPILFEKYGVPRSSINSAQLSIEADNITSNVTQQVANTISDAVMNGKTIEIDLTYSNLQNSGINFSSIGGTKAPADGTNNYKAEAVFIPVGINLNTAAGKRGEGWDIVIERSFDRSMGYPYYSTHGGGSPVSDANVYSSGDGFEFAVAWHTVGSGWGTTWYVQGSTDAQGWYDNEKNIVNSSDPNYGKDTYRYILQNETNWTRTRTYTYNNTSYSIPQDLMCGSIRQDSFDTVELIYLRGGSKYRIHTDNYEATATIYSGANGYSVTRGGRTAQMPIIYPDSWDKIINPVIDTMKRSEIVQTANEIQLNVYDNLHRTGIDIESGTITLDANNTIINGSLKIYNAQDGLVIFNDQGQKAVEVIKDSIGAFGTNQNITNHLSASTHTCTYIVGNNGGFRMYIDQFNTSKEDNYGGYPIETYYYGQTQHLPAILRLGRHNNGETLTFKNVQWTMEGSYSGNRTDYKVKARLYWLNSDHIVSWENNWQTPNYSNGVFSMTLPNYTVTSTGSGYEWTLLLDFKGPNPSDNRSKSYKFNVTADLVSNISINTKIGTDGYRTVTPTSETWVGQNQITNLYYGSGTNLYGSNYKLFGTSVDKYGTNNVFGSATIDTTNGTPMSTPSYINIGSVAPLIKVSSSTTTDNDTNRLNGTIGWESFSYNPILPRIIVKHYGVHIIPKYILIEGRHPSYSNNNHLIMLNAGTSESDYLPIGTEVIIINHSGTTMYACGYNASGTTNLPYCIYDDDTTTLYKAMQIGNGGTFGFIHVGGGKWKPIQLHGGGSSSPTNF